MNICKLSLNYINCNVLESKFKQDPHQIPRYAYRIISSSWDYADSIVELLKACDGNRPIAASIDGYPRHRINERSRIDVKLTNHCIFVYWEKRRFLLLEPSEHRRGLNEVDMVMKVARKTVARSPDQVIVAFRMLPDVIGLQTMIG